MSALRPLREHQERAIIRTAPLAGVGPQAPDGANADGLGKTLDCSAHIIRGALDKGKRVAFVRAAQITLIDQPVE